MNVPIAKTYAKALIEYVGDPFKKNGRAYVNVLLRCGRCGGSGNYSYNQIDGTRCFRCGGSGKENAEVRWYTEAEIDAQERAAEHKKEKLREEKLEAAPLERKNFLKRNGFSEDGFSWVFLGDTFPYKDLIKEAGGVFGIIGWHIAHEPKIELADGTVLPYTRVSAEEVLDFSVFGVGSFKEEAKTLIQEKTKALEPEKRESAYVGSIGERLREVPCTVKRVRGVPSAYGDAKLVVMEDKANNVLVWLTTATVKVSEKDSILLTGTIKEHSIYRGEKQTTLSRCILKKVEKETLCEWSE